MPRKPTGRDEALLTVRMRQEELEEVRRRAKARDLTMSEWARRKLLEADRDDDTDTKEAT